MSHVTRTATALVVAVSTLMLTTACGPDDTIVPPTTSTSPSSSSTAAPSTTPSTTTKPETTAERSLRMSGDAVVSYWAKLDALASDPKKPLSELATVARGQARSQWQRNLTLLRGANHKQVGSAVVEMPSATYDAKARVFNVRACVDVSKVNVVDQDGKSVVSANRQPRVRYAYQVTQSSDGFFVTQDLLQGTAC